jgi:hypothetical protein
MKGFQIRIELYGADYPTDYDMLDEPLDKAGFERAVHVNNTIRKLPTSEYMFWDEEHTADQVLEHTIATITPLWGDFGVVVGEITDLRSHGLKLAFQPLH